MAPSPSSRPPRLLVMGTPTPNGFDPFIASLAGRFGLVQVRPDKVEPQWQSCHNDPAAQPTLMQPLPEPIDNPAAAPQNQALLYTYNFAPRQTDPPQLTVSYLLWPPLTAEVKCRTRDGGRQRSAKAGVCRRRQGLHRRQARRRPSLRRVLPQGGHPSLRPGRALQGHRRDMAWRHQDMHARRLQ